LDASCFRQISAPVLLLLRLPTADNSTLRFDCVDELDDMSSRKLFVLLHRLDRRKSYQPSDISWRNDRFSLEKAVPRQPTRKQSPEYASAGWSGKRDGMPVRDHCSIDAEFALSQHARCVITQAAFSFVGENLAYLLTSFPLTCFQSLPVRLSDVETTSRPITDRRNRYTGHTIMPDVTRCCQPIVLDHLLDTLRDPPIADPGRSGHWNPAFFPT
jgi:hypothetical protein